MIPVPAGSIVLRDARTRTERTVWLQPFHISSTPVTWELYSRVLGVAVPDGEDKDAPAHSISWTGAVSWCNTLSVEMGLAPAYELSNARVCWDVSATGFRLPTEAEWERACRADSTGPRYGPLRDVAWSDADAVTGTQRVGHIKAVHDLPPADPEREARQVARLRALAVRSGLDPDFAEKFLSFMVREVIRHHEDIKAEYEGAG